VSGNGGSTSVGGHENTAGNSPGHAGDSTSSSAGSGGIETGSGGSLAAGRGGGGVAGHAGSDAAGRAGSSQGGSGGTGTGGDAGTATSGQAGISGDAGSIGTTAGAGGASDLPDLNPNEDVADLTSEEMGELCDWYAGLFGGYNVTTVCPAGGSSQTPRDQAFCVTYTKYRCPVTVAQFETCMLSTVPSGGCDTPDCDPLFCM
jgi:hypothetical protein